MIRKLINLASWNTLGAVLNFFSNITIARFFGVELFGEFSILSSKVAIIGLVFVLIPSNYSVIKYQEDLNYRSIFPSYFILVNFIYLTSLFLSINLNIIKNNFFVVAFFSLSLLNLNFFDIVFQAKNQLLSYFKMLFYNSLFKIILLLFVYYFYEFKDFNQLLLIIGISNFIVIFYYLVINFEIINYKLQFKKLIYFIKDETLNFKAYYFQSIIKRISDNLIILLFNNLLTKRDVGILSLFFKSQTFSFSIFRIFESFFINKKNINESFEKIFRNKIYIGLILFTLTFFISLIYIYIVDSNVYLYYSLLISLAGFPYIYQILYRSIYITQYRNREINISLILSVLFVFSGYILILLLHPKDILFYVFFIIFFTELIKSFFLKINFNNIYKI